MYLHVLPQIIACKKNTITYTSVQIVAQNRHKNVLRGNLLMQGRPQQVQGPVALCKTCSVQLCILDQPRVDNSNRLKAGPGCLKTLTNTLLEVLSGVHVQLDLSLWSEVTDFFIQSPILRSRDKIVILIVCRNLVLIFFRFLTTLLLHFCTSTSNAVVIFVEQK